MVASNLGNMLVSFFLEHLREGAHGRARQCAVRAERDESF
jgi:hypothetical protein